MSLLSFDIGIKNLSYCVLCKSDKKIKGWGIINLSLDSICSHINTKGTQCDKSAGFKTVDGKILCNSHSKLKQYESEKKMKKIKKNNSIHEIGKLMIKKFNDIPLLLECEDVIVENQPSLKNPTMKTIQMLVYSYFLIKSEPIRLDMINARNKLKAYNGPKINCDIKDRYKLNKFLAIKYCDYMIKNEGQTYIELFNNSKKKDDLSDSYLQGMYYLQL
jgi:hypothetical protein|tara:strand:+ start:211 stop:864 length:654 start_codon:yes stop_codon:yes gene_type:complete